jgi:hypothetical protein
MSINKKRRIAMGSLTRREFLASILVSPMITVAPEQYSDVEECSCDAGESAFTIFYISGITTLTVGWHYTDRGNHLGRQCGGLFRPGV